MLKPTEIRIGNIVEFEGKPVQVASIDIDGWKCKVEGCERVLSIHLRQWEDTKPIRITEEKLKEFGFEGDCFFFTNDEFKIEKGISTPGWYFRKRISDDSSVFLRIIDYVHQLQNIIFQLTGKELEVKK